MVEYCGNWVPQLGTLTGLLSLLGCMAGTLIALPLALFCSLCSTRLSPAILMRWHQGRLLRRSWLGYIKYKDQQSSWLRSSPALYYVPSSALNAFAVGNRLEGGIAVTDGLLRTLSYREIRAV